MDRFMDVFDELDFLIDENEGGPDERRDET